ncbi:hypothetical protein ABZ635_11725 [Nocardiopsis sp. NPDC007018]|uniref:type II toxin-antitoxin system VapC family toxin n=1 Tax=Nocardiopsis sp. NPDC007018 TaxID=3155721 RepID=UPI0033F3B93E
MKVLRPQGFVLDAGALREAEANPRGVVWSLCRRENQAGRQPLLPSAVLAQIWRGGARQAAIARVVKVTETVELDERMARRIGKLLGMSGTTDVVDAMVALVAMEAGAAVVTSDPVDLAKLVDSVQGDVPLVTV